MSKVSNWAIIEKLAVLEHHCKGKGITKLQVFVSFYLVILNQSASSQPRTFFPFASAATSPTFAPTHLP